MRGILKTASNFLMKLLYFKLQYVMIAYQWLLRFFKLRLRKWKKCGLQKDLDRAVKDLGTEVYSIHARDGALDFGNIPAVKQKLTMVKEAESKLLQAQDLIEVINGNYLEKKDGIKEKYAARRARIDEARVEEE